MLKVKRKLNAIIAIEIIITMTLYYFIFVGVTAVTYALDIVKTNHENIDFSAYFLDSKGEKVNKIEMATDTESQYLYVDITVHNEGYFNGSVNLENNNFNIKPNKLSTEISEISGNEVKLNQINAGNTVTIKLEVEPNFGNKITEESLTANTNVTLKGQYINSKNVEKEKNIEISGSTEVGISWKSSEQTNVELETGLLTNHIYNIQNENKRIVQILIKIKITNNNYPDKSTEINLDVPQEVKNVQVHTRSTKATNNDIAFNENNYTYNKQENKLSIKLNNDDSNNVNWEKDAKDIIVVTYELDENSNYAQNGINIEDKITIYDNKELVANNSVNIENDIDGIVTTDLKSKYNDLPKESNSEKEFSLEDPTEELVLKLSEHIIYGNVSDLMLFDIKRELLCTAIFHVIGSDTEKLYIDMDNELHKVLNLLISKTWEEELKKDPEDTLAGQYYHKLAEFDIETKNQVLREVILQLGAYLAKHSFAKENVDSDSMEFPEI